MTTLADTIAANEATLAEHRFRDVLGDYEIAPYYKHFGCTCGWEQNIAGMSGWRSWLAAYDRHVATVLAEQEAQRRKASLDMWATRGVGGVL